MFPGVMIDDTDSRIHYAGQGWFQDQGSQDLVGSNGPTYNRTSHRTNGNDSLSFTFEGISITVYGTSNLTRIDNNTRWDPTLECFIDKISIGATDPKNFRDAGNNWALCGGGILNDGQHEITVNITSTGNTFWLDYLVFTPSPKASFNEVVLKVGHGETFLDNNWGPLNSARTTNVNGSQARFDFVGTSVTWVGRVPTENSNAPALGSFVIDGGPPTSFKLNGLPLTNKTTMYHQEFFTTPDLPPGPHSLLVTYDGANAPATPLTLDYLYVTNTSTQGGSSKTPVGAVVGGVVGGIAFIALVFFLFWWRRRQRRASFVRSEPQPTLDDTSSAPYAVTPFMSGYQTPQPQSYTPAQPFHKNSKLNSLPPNGVGTVAQTRAMGNGQEAVLTLASVQHQDSRHRLPQQDAIVEIPPLYTIA